MYSLSCFTKSHIFKQNYVPLQKRLYKTEYENKCFRMFKIHILQVYIYSACTHIVSMM